MPPRAWRRSATALGKLRVPPRGSASVPVLCREGPASIRLQAGSASALLTSEPAFPAYPKLRNAGRFPGTGRGSAPDFNDLIPHQLHVGTYTIMPGNS